MNLIEKVKKAMPTEPEEGDEYIKGFRDCGGVIVEYAEKKIGAFTLTVVENKELLAEGLSKSDLCPYQFDKSMPIAGKCGNDNLNKGKCYECWLKCLKGGK